MVEGWGHTGERLQRRDDWILTTAWIEGLRGREESGMTQGWSLQDWQEGAALYGKREGRRWGVVG